MSNEQGARFLEALPEGLFRPEQVPVVFHTMGMHRVMVAHLPFGESRAHRGKMFSAEPPPKPTSRCFPR
jgi:hypothetical protein